MNDNKNCMTPEIAYNLGRLKQIPGEATFSEDNLYRYTLTRKWGIMDKSLIITMMNPSTASESILDPTIRKVLQWSIIWGYDKLIVLNLFAYRSTEMKQIFQVSNPIGPDNDYHIIETLENNKLSLHIAAWGKKGNFLERDHQIRTFYTNLGIPLHYLVLNSDGTPSHPLYLSKNTTPTLWK